MDMIDLEALREAIADCNQHKNEMNGIYLTADEANDILTMLEEQEKRNEPKAVEIDREMDSGLHLAHCPNCWKFINSDFHYAYCGYCGQAVMWDEA